ncbi:M20 family metallopeptidase [Alkaliphilus peptidifermentans]|uniref:Amidohydrolase n=1 Tax=Alkaliphilus peptidifermentans DSM 18978 TaxID=1120976 RepID=A0A1G5F3C0_9FIRM|nr:M20 family metallopeptidase [Alkaliphilus peptidifermentans]SCY33745.1 amidohydrolase [Alkaliphilus peptidifermentans DSM 18978]
MDIKELARKQKQYVIDLRRDFHKYPEASWQEVRTSQKIKEELDKMRIPYTSIAKTGVIATITGGNKGKTVALRADMDALQVHEKNDVAYSSQNFGIMHACGHDGHTAMLLGAAKILNDVKDEINGTVKLIFQPAEEIAQGARLMVEQGALNGIDNIFAIHLWADLPTGTISVQEGPRMASADIFKVIVKGKGGHGSLPHQGVDAIVSASAIVMDIQSIVSREISPLESAVVSVGVFQSGTRFNVIASEAILEGTTRCFNPEIRNEFPNILERVIRNTAASYRAEATLEYTFGTPPTINDAASAAIAQKSVEQLIGKDALIKMDKITGGEDFALFVEKVPGAIAFVGVRNEAKKACYPHHHPMFSIDEDGLEIGTALYAQYAVDYLNKNN